MFKGLEKKIKIPSNVTIELLDNYSYVSGSKGKITHKTHELLMLNIINNELVIGYKDNNNNRYRLSYIKSLINTNYALFNNFIFGVNNYFESNLVLSGIGYKVEYKKEDHMLEMSLGYSHSVKFKVPSDIIIEVFKKVEIVVKGISKHKVGQISANIRNMRVPDIYKGNGIRYKNERISFKVPKKSK